MKKTPAELANCYERVTKKIDEAYDLLIEARELYKQTYDDNTFDPVSRNNWGTEDAHRDVIKDLNKRSWRRIIDLMQVKKLASNKRWKEIQDRLYGDGDMPNISENEIIRMYQSFVDNANIIFAESVKEVWDYLRPGKSKFDTYKTNNPNRICKKVILTGVLRHLWDGKLTINHYYEKEIINVDKVFHALDSNTANYLDGGYRSELIDAINENPEQGETQYFSWRGYHNGNLHLTIKRMDLVDEMAKILAENSLVGK